MPSLRRKSRLSKVNTRHLLDDVADSYRHSIEQTLVVEAVANALDAGASQISFIIDKKVHSIAVLDNGSGMTEDEFDRCHDLAESSRVRGTGIGFARLGAKLAHLLSSRIQTDTTSDSYRAGSDWHWQGDDLRFKIRRSRIKENGTRVEYFLEDHQSNLLNTEWLEATLLEHFAPLLESELSMFYVWNSTYPNGVVFRINDRELSPRPLVREVDSTAYRDVLPQRGKKAIGKAIFVLSVAKLDEHLQGVALTTHGKVILRMGFGLTPADSERITGWAEIPDLVGCLTLNKQDFITHGQIGHKYRRLRDQVKLVYSQWLRDIGKNVDAQEARNAPRRLESELAELTKLVPEIDFLFGRRAQKKIPVRSDAGDVAADEVQGNLLTEGGTATSSKNGNIPVDVGTGEGTALKISATGVTPVRKRRRTTKRGPQVRLVDEPDRSDMSWIDAEAVLINTAHPAYTKAQREGQVRYHQRTAALIALCDAASETTGLALLRQAISHWGGN
jgi:hypothetical protein